MNRRDWFKRIAPVAATWDRERGWPHPAFLTPDEMVAVKLRARTALIDKLRGL